MSDEFTVYSSRKTIKKLKEILDVWIKTVQKQHQFLVTVFSNPEKYYIFGDGSIRGISLTPSSSFLKGGQIQVRLSLMASQADWKYCYSFLAYLKRTQRAKIVNENGEKIEDSHLTDEQAAEKGKQSFQTGAELNKVIIDVKPEEPLELPTLWFDLKVTKNDLANVDKSENGYLELEQLLVERANRLRLCRHRDQIVLKNGITLNAISPEPAIYSDADFAVISRKGIFETPADLTEMVFVKFNEFLIVFHEKVEQVKKKPNYYYFSGIDPQNNHDIGLYESLLKLGQNNILELNKSGGR